jgi:rRNA-processing protein Efg1
MVKAPSSKGLGKFKPWRRGVNKKSKGSIKQQLRGQERLLGKASSDEQRRAIQAKIDDLRRQHDARKEKEVEREHAKKSHGTRFLERQRLTRMLKKAADAAAVSAAAGGNNYESSVLLRIAVDQVYVGHYPHDKRYIKLFRSGQRVVDAPKDLVQRAKIRDRILRDLAAKGPASARVDWISADQYERLPASWSVEDERRMFGERGVTAKAKDGSSDTRFVAPAMSDAHQKLLAAAEDAERQAMEEDVHNNSDSEADDNDEGDSDVSDEANSDNKKTPQRPRGESDDEASNDDGDAATSDDSSSSSSSSASSSSSSESEDEGSVAKEKNPVGDTAQHGAPLTGPLENDDNDEDDDFLVDATGDEETNAFAQAPLVKGLDTVRGDKSQGWATQRQTRPGQYNKKGRPGQQRGGKNNNNPRAWKPNPR